MNLNSLKLTKTHDIEATLSYVVAGSFLIALCAQIQIPLGFTPVPITLQTFSVLLLSRFLGARNAMMSVIIYLAEGMIGFPVLAGGNVNPFALIGPTGGYLLGLVGLAYMAGWFFERKEHFSRTVVFSGVCAASLMNLGLGALWLSYFVGASHTVEMGILPFIPGEMLKIMAVAGYSSSVKR